MMGKIVCPCCGYYTIDSDEEVIFEICEVCFWQYDEVAHLEPQKSIGANGISLEEARENYKKYGACTKEFADQSLVRIPYKDELPQNNQN